MEDEKMRCCHRRASSPRHTPCPKWKRELLSRPSAKTAQTIKMRPNPTDGIFHFGRYRGLFRLSIQHVIQFLYIRVGVIVVGIVCLLNFLLFIATSVSFDISSFQAGKRRI